MPPTRPTLVIEDPDVAPALTGAEGAELAVSADRARSADRELAVALGRTAPSGRAATASSCSRKAWSGLLRALERFDPDRGVPLWGYTAFWVRQAMQQPAAELTRPLVLSDRALRNLAHIKDAHRSALQATGREPDRHELASRAGLTVEQVDSLIVAERRVSARSYALGTGSTATSRRCARSPSGSA